MLLETQQIQDLAQNEQPETLSQNLCYQSLKIIGKGGFCRVYEGNHLKFKEPVAIKASPKRELINREKSILEEIMKHKLTDHGKVFNLNCIVLPLYGHSLMDLLCARWDRKFSMKTVCQIGIQTINILRKFHDIGFLHRDIKLDNILLSSKDTGKAKEIILIDLGLSQKYKDRLDVHKPKCDEGVFVGNQIFASRRAMEMKNQSRRDDLESLFYMLKFLLNGELPWKLKHQKSLSFDEIYELKASYTPFELWPNLSKCFRKIAYLIWNLKYDQEPHQVDFIFDWNDDQVYKKNEQLNSTLNQSTQAESNNMTNTNKKNISNLIQYLPEARQRALSIDIPGTIKDSLVVNNITQINQNSISQNIVDTRKITDVNIIKEEDNEESSSQFISRKSFQSRNHIENDQKNEDQTPNFYQLIDQEDTIRHNVAFQLMKRPSLIFKQDFQTLNNMIGIDVPLQSANLIDETLSKDIKIEKQMDIQKIQQSDPCHHHQYLDQVANNDNVQQNNIIIQQDNEYFGLAAADLLSFNSKDCFSGIEEFKESHDGTCESGGVGNVLHSGFNHNFNRYSMSPKNNKMIEYNSPQTQGRSFKVQDSKSDKLITVFRVDDLINE
eukprot:403370905